MLQVLPATLKLLRIKEKTKMMLITKAIEKKAPALGSQSEKKADKVKVVAKFFNPFGIGTWYMTEYDPETKMAFGYCDLGYAELGYFSITELEELRMPPFGGKIERATNFAPSTLQNVMDSCAKLHGGGAE